MTEQTKNPQVCWECRSFGAVWCACARDGIRPEERPADAVSPLAWLQDEVLKDLAELEHAEETP